MDERTKQRLLLAVVAFNITVILYILVAQFTAGSVGGYGAFFMRFLVAAGIGLGVAVVVFFGSALAGK